VTTRRAKELIAVKIHYNSFQGSRKEMLWARYTWELKHDVISSQWLNWIMRAEILSEQSLRCIPTPFKHDSVLTVRQIKKLFHWLVSNLCCILWPCLSASTQHGTQQVSCPLLSSFKGKFFSCLFLWPLWRGYFGGWGPVLLTVAIVERWPL